MINFCTTVKNRTWQLKQTLPTNISYIKQHTNTKLLILNYNSTDDLNDYLLSNYREEINLGLIEYYILDKILPSFDMSLAKNLIHSQATGGVLFNLDADNFIDNILINELSLLKDNQILLPYQGKDVTHSFYRDTGRCGRIGITFNTFHKLKGYDESIKGLGADDGDFIRRAFSLGLRPIVSEERSLTIPNVDESKLKILTKENRGVGKTINDNYLNDGYTLTRIY